ncbi:MAG TPA: PA14 domain-containing protein [Kiritimatiellia bacterium]|nr:PA14 domain-containing protein [Kiritimatiellia bacterium]HPS06200.1 PA14 domain-containing protein [Kiritimatiellia bacterium]
MILIAAMVGKGSKKPVLTARSARPVAVAKAGPEPAAKAAEAVAPAESDETVKLHAETPPPAQVKTAQPAVPRPSPRTVMRDIPAGSPHGLLCDYYERIPDKYITNLRASDKFPGQPDRTVQIGNFELSENTADQYGVRVRGFLTPPQSGKYTFEVSVDDSAELWLSTDATPDNMRKLVSINAWVKGWGARPDQRSAACELEVGRRYYIEALMKEGTGLDFLAVGWSGPVSDKTVVIAAQYLQPWTGTAPQQLVAKSASAAETRREVRAARAAALAPARGAVEEQMRINGKAYRFAEAAQALKAGKTAWSDPESSAFVATSIERLELLQRLRAYVQSELARSRLKGVWVAFGGQLDVTGASDEGVTVAPGRIVAWAKIPPEQMLRLINAVVPRASVDAGTKSALFLASAVFCREISGGVDLALKYRERAVALNSTLAAAADRVLGGSPDEIVARPRIEAARAELSRQSESAAGLSEPLAQRRSDLNVLVNGLLPGLLVEFWEGVTCRSLDEFRKQGVMTNRPPDSSQRLAEFATPESHGEKYVARVKGYLTPPETGDYVFFIAADDQGEMWLSFDQDSSRAKLCVKTDTHTGRWQWDPDQRKSEAVRLVKGERYFVMALLREGEKGDHLAVAWRPAGEDKPVLIAGENLLCEPASGLPPAAQEIRKEIEQNAQRVQTLAEEVIRLHEEDAARELAHAPVTSLAADEVQKQTQRAKEVIAQAKDALAQIDAALPRLKAALQPEGGQTRK